LGEQFPGVKGGLVRNVIGIGGIGLGFIIVLCLGVRAAEKVEEAAGVPRSPAAVAAVKKYERAAARAREAYQAALAAAGRDLKGEMDAAMKAAMRAQNLDEAKRIEAAVRQAEASAGTGAGGGTFVVKAVLYGGPDKRFDLTQDLAKAGWVRDGSVDLPKDLATTLGKDPAPGRLKDLQLLLTVGGTDVRISTNDVTRLQIQAGPPGR
jgi:hypothetical protein